MGPEAYDRLLKALSLVYGIESYVVLRDIWGASYREVEVVARWMLEALIESALRRAPAAPHPALSPKGRGRRTTPSRSRR